MLAEQSSRGLVVPRPAICGTRMFVSTTLSALLLAASSAPLVASTLTVTGAKACSGATAQVQVHLALNAGVQVNGLTLKLEVKPDGGATALQSPLDFQAGDVAAPSFKMSDSSYLRVSWLQIAPSLQGTTLIGHLQVPIPSGARAGDGYTIHVADVQANNGLTPMLVEPGPDATLVVTCCQAEDCDDGNPCTTDSCDAASGLCAHAPSRAVEVGITSFSVPTNANVGQKATLTVLIENSGCSDASVRCTVARGNRVVGTKKLTIPKGRDGRVTFSYKYSSGDAPRACFTATVVAEGDADLANNRATGCTTVL